MSVQVQTSHRVDFCLFSKCAHYVPHLSQHGQCSWMEVHQFIGDLITSGNASKDQPDVLNAVWGVAGGDDALGFKGPSVEPLQQPRPARGKSDTEPGRQNQRKEEARDRREGQSPNKLQNKLRMKMNLKYSVF